MKTLNFNDTVDAVREIISKAGADFVYSETEAFEVEETCLYVYGGEPSCLVGQFLAKVHGVSLNVLADREGENALAAVEAAGFDMRDEQTRLAAWWLAHLQSRQDEPGATWGDAFDAAQDWAKYELLGK